MASKKHSSSGDDCDMLPAFLSLAEKACSEYHVCVEPDVRQCRDAYFGTLLEISCSPKLNPCPVDEGLKKPLPGMIVFVLESPHKDEYADKKPKEVWPIQGPSGDNFLVYLPKIIPVEMKEWGVFVVNAIQYQCSQGLSLERGFNRAAKNYIVGSLLQLKEFRDGLRDRVRPFFEYTNKTPCIILNACTSYTACNIGKKNKVLVNEILEVINGVRTLDKLTHPSCWSREGPDKMTMWQNLIHERWIEIQNRRNEMSQ